MDEALAEKRPQRRRRWLQFSLRTLLAGVLAVSLGMSWLAVRMERVKKQEKAVEVLEQFPCAIEWDFQRSGRPSGTRPKGPPGPAWARKLFGEHFFADVEFVCLAAGDDFTDAEMVHIGELTSLKFLHLGTDGITDAGVAYLRGLRDLEELHLLSCQVSDAGLEHLRGLSHLRELWLRDTQVSDAGLVQLTALGALESLDLDGTGITDAALESLNGLARIEYLDLSGTQVTPEGVRKLREALPECEIVYQTRAK